MASVKSILPLTRHSLSLVSSVRNDAARNDRYVYGTCVCNPAHALAITLDCVDAASGVSTTMNEFDLNL